MPGSAASGTGSSWELVGGLMDARLWSRMKGFDLLFYQCLGETPCPAGSVELAQAASAYEESFWDVTAFVGGGA